MIVGHRGSAGPGSCSIAIGARADGDEITSFHASCGKGAGAAVGAALKLLPGQGVVAMTDRNCIPRLAFGIPARHVGYWDQHAVLPSSGFLEPLCVANDEIRLDPPHLAYQQVML
jgi:hypothetical protein